MQVHHRLACRRKGITLDTKKKDLVYLQNRLDEPNRPAPITTNPRLHFVFQSGTAEEESSGEGSSDAGVDDGEDDFNPRGRARSRWSKLHNVLKVVQEVERLRELEEEEAMRQRAALSPVKKVSMTGPGRNRKKKGGSTFGSGSGSGFLDGARRKHGLSSSTRRAGACTTLLWEGTDREEVLYHIVSKTKTKPDPFSPVRPFSAKSIVKPDQEAIRYSKYAMDGDTMDVISSSEKCKRTRKGLFRHNSFGNYAKVSPFERVGSPKSGPLLLHTASSHLFEHPNHKSSDGISCNRFLHSSPSSAHNQQSSVDIGDYDMSTTSTELLEGFLSALRDTVPHWRNGGG